MKKYFPFIFSGMLGGLLVLGGLKYWIEPKLQTVANTENGLAVAVSENTSPVTGPDFSLSAEKALKVVVQINAQESDQLVKQKQEELSKKYSNPFSDHPFFREFDMRGFGFGTPYYNQKKGSGSGGDLFPGRLHRHQ
jgi:hypothetical protein